MRRLLSSIGHTHLPSAGGGRTPVAMPAAPPLFLGFFPLCPIHGAGALPQFRPSPLFDGG